MMSQKAIAIIPARGGSKGIPNKNLATVGGITLLSRAIDACKSSNLISAVYVSTDSDEIAQVAIAHGAVVIRRPAEISGDQASSESALLHALDEIATTSTLPKHVLFAQCTSPFISRQDVDGVLETVKSHDCALTVTNNHAFLWRKSADGNAVGINHDSSVRLPRQLLESEFRETGALYAMDIDQFRSVRHRFFGSIGLYEVPVERSMEIDDPQDLRLANSLDLQHRSVPSKEVLREIRAIVFDFDGVITDDQVYISESGEEMVMASRSDGMGISALKNAGIPMLILSKERNMVVTKRAEKLQVDVIQACDDKLVALKTWLNNGNIQLSECAYVGNDINDLDCMNSVRLAIAPADCHDEVAQIAHWKLSRPGGKGAIRELSDTFLDR